MTQHLLEVYNRSPIDLDRGEGSWLIAKDGTRYLDCVAGIATCSLGHANPDLIEALTQQAEKLWHVSNLFRVEGQDILAEKLTRYSFADRVFFANSGTEAIECALKMARKYHAARGDKQRIDIVGLSGSFHGRTYAAVNASGNKTYIDGFGPALPGYLQMDPDNLDAMEQVIAQPSTAAVIVEPVQGEGGARALSGEWLKRVRSACTGAGVLLIYDEVQCGMGRTGQLFAHQWFADAEPDIMAIAKALGGGFPVGACLASEAASAAMVFGTHGSTFGGNPLAMAVANRAFDILSTSVSLAHVEARSRQFFVGLQDAALRYPDVIVDVRGKGLLIGVKLVPNNREFMALAREQRLLVAGGGDNCVRFVPALNFSATEVDEAVDRFVATCKGLSSQMKAAA